MIGLPEPEVVSVAERVLDLLPSGVAADARVETARWGTMRFANGAIHQPHLESLTELSLRVVDARRVATATTLDLSRAGLRRTVAEALSLARCAPEETKFPGFPGDSPRGRASLPYSRATAELDPIDQGRWVARLLDGARSAAPDGRIAGVAHFGATELAVANTSGRRARSRRSIVTAQVLVERVGVDAVPSGWSEVAHFDHRALDPSALGREAGERAARTPPRAIGAGAYRVLLDGSAVAKLVGELGYLGFGARGAEEGWSCLARQRGRRIAPEGFDLTDDARSERTVPQAIDAEGTAKRRTPLVVDGLAGGPTLDLLTAARLGARPTGHAFAPEAPWGELGAMPQNPIVSAGEAKDLEELVRETRRGILVTRFHYVRTVHAGRSVLTGMTRDGTYRIERGELAGPVHNLRFTESILRALKGIELWGRERRCYPSDDERGAICVTAPAAVVKSFRFTSATVF